jgi:hypothetical protein
MWAPSQAIASRALGRGRIALFRLEIVDLGMIGQSWCASERPACRRRNPIRHVLPSTALGPEIAKVYSPVVELSASQGATRRNSSTISERGTVGPDTAAMKTSNPSAHAGLGELIRRFPEVVVDLFDAT